MALKQRHSSVPVDIVDDVLSYFVTEHGGNQKTFSSCALVCRTWIPLARRHRYKTLEYVIHSPEDYKLFYDRRCVGNFVTLNNFARDVDTFSPVGGCIQRLLFDFDPLVNVPDAEAEGDLENPQTYEPSEQAPPFSLTPLISALERLTALRMLAVPVEFLYISPTTITLTAPAISHLECLMVSDEIHSTNVGMHNFYSFLSIFGIVQRLCLRNVNVFDWPASEERPGVPTHVWHPSVECLQLHKEFSVATSLYSLLSMLPAAHLMTCLDLAHIPLENIPDLVSLIKLCKTNLEYISFQLDENRQEPSYLVGDQYLLVDLTQCEKLQAVSLKIMLPHVKCAVDGPIMAFPHIAHTLDAFIKRCLPPSLHRLDLKLYQYQGELDWSSFTVKPQHNAEDILLRALRTARISTLSLTPRFSEVLGVTNWDKLTSLFPRLLEQGLLLNKLGIEKLRWLDC